MIRLILCLGIVICSAIAGAHFAQRLVCRRDTLRQLADMLRRAGTLMSYNSGDLYEIFSDNFAGFDFPRDKPFDADWNSFIEVVSDMLSKDDIILLKKFTDGIGVTDNESQQQHIALYVSLLEEQTARAQSEIDSRSKLYRTLPVSLGLLISILII